MSSGGVPPIGGENAEHVKMAAYLIFKRPLKVISKLLAEMPELKGNGHFQMFTAIFARWATSR